MVNEWVGHDCLHLCGVRSSTQCPKLCTVTVRNISNSVRTDQYVCVV